MDDNMFEAVQVSMWVFLFIFALTFALIQYNRVEAVTDLFVEANMFNSREDFIGVYLDKSEIQRDTDRSEIIFSILNIPDMVNETGNKAYKVTITSNGTETKFNYFEELEDGNVVSQGVTANGNNYYIIGDIPDGVSIRNAEKLVSDLKTYDVKNASDRYYVKYDNNGIYYTKK